MIHFCRNGGRFQGSRSRRFSILWRTRCHHMSIHFAFWPIYMPLPLHCGLRVSRCAVVDFYTSRFSYSKLRDCRQESIAMGSLVNDGSVPVISVIEGSLEVKLPTIWTDEEQRWEESEKRKEERRSKKRNSEERRSRRAKR